MYSNGYGASDITNNPFINDPTNPQSRFPDISGGSSPQDHGHGASYTQWLQPSMNATPMGYIAQPGNYQQPSYQQQPSQQFNPGYSQPQTSYLTPGSPPNVFPQQTGMPFQPTSSFGQHLAANISGSSYGYLQGQSPGPQSAGYNPAQQQIQNPGYIAQFDPYASIGQGWDGQPTNLNQNQNQNPSQNPQSPAGGGFTATSPTGSPHPREYIRTHKGEIEAWDNYAWKQLLNAFDGLKDSWVDRTKELGGKIGQLQAQMQYGGGYYPGQIPQEIQRFQGLLKDAQLNSDSVAASSYQMHEVFQGYRQSGDQASKRRVREASNAALQGLPDWPPQMY